jgi:hypothetical protein
VWVVLLIVVLVVLAELAAVGMPAGPVALPSAAIACRVGNYTRKLGCYWHWDRRACSLPPETACSVRWLQESCQALLLNHL